MMLRFNTEVLWLSEGDLTESHITWEFNDLRYHFLSESISMHRGAAISLQCFWSWLEPQQLNTAATSVLQSFASLNTFPQSAGDDKFVNHGTTECHDLLWSHFILAKIAALYSNLVQREPIPKYNTTQMFAKTNTHWEKILAIHLTTYD